MEVLIKPQLLSLTIMIVSIYSINSNKWHIHVHAAVTINFSQSSYSVNEDDGVALLELILSNPSSMDFTIQVISNNITALSQ